MNHLSQGASWIIARIDRMAGFNRKMLSIRVLLSNMTKLNSYLDFRSLRDFGSLNR